MKWMMQGKLMVKEGESWRHVSLVNPFHNWQALSNLSFYFFLSLDATPRCSASVPDFQLFIPACTFCPAFFCYYASFNTSIAMDRVFKSIIANIRKIVLYHTSGNNGISIMAKALNTTLQKFTTRNAFSLTPSTKKKYFPHPSKVRVSSSALNDQKRWTTNILHWFTPVK